jgi:hypothetical protein
MNMDPQTHPLKQAATWSSRLIGAAIAAVAKAARATVFKESIILLEWKIEGKEMGGEDEEGCVI